jgi:hypothetical protein
MLTTLVPLCLALLAAPPSPAATASRDGVLTPEAIGEAIEWGKTAGEAELEQHVLKIAPTWTVTYDTPRLRVAQLARQWKRRGRELSVSSVPGSIIRKEVHVYALARAQPGVTAPVANIVHVALHYKNALSMEQPRWVTSNLARARAAEDPGLAKIARSVTAAFPLSAFRPGGELRLAFDGGARESIPVGEIIDRIR